MQVESFVKGVGGKISFLQLTDRELFPLANCTVILEDSAVGEDCGLQSVPETLDESISWRRLISPETRAKQKI